MKFLVSLQEFMPYGAPDLIRAQRPDLTRALALSSSFALFTLVAAALLAPLSPRPRAALLVPAIIEFAPPRLAAPEPPPAPAARVTPRARPLDSRLGMPKIGDNDRPLAPDIPPGYGELAKQVQPGTGELAPPSSGRVAPALDPDAPATHVEEMPVAITVVKPEYPPDARDAMVDGLVIVLVLVGRDGHVREARLDEKAHVPMLDAAALDAAKRWVFAPATVGGHPVAVWTALPFRFRLE